MKTFHLFLMVIFTVCLVSCEPSVTEQKEFKASLCQAIDRCATQKAFELLDNDRYKSYMFYDYEYETMLYRAVFRGCADIVGGLLKKGFPVNHQHRMRIVYNKYHRTYSKMKSGNYNYQGTALHLAVSMKHPEVVRVLLENGANPDAVDFNKETPLMGAALNGHLKIAKLLIEHGCDVNKRNNRGGYALSFANNGLNENRNPDLVQLLIDNGAK
jgi:ankyrin repeat protein